MSKVQQINWLMIVCNILVIFCLWRKKYCHKRNHSTPPCRCARMYKNVVGMAYGHGIIYPQASQLSFEAVSIFPHLLHILHPPLALYCPQKNAISRLISRKNMVGGLETLETSTLLGPSYRGRCCHCRCRDPAQHTSGEKRKNTHFQRNRETDKSKITLATAVNG